MKIPKDVRKAIERRKALQKKWATKLYGIASDKSRIKQLKDARDTFKQSRQEFINKLQAFFGLTNADQVNHAIKEWRELDRAGLVPAAKAKQFRELDYWLTKLDSLLKVNAKRLRELGEK